MLTHLIALAILTGGEPVTDGPFTQTGEVAASKERTVTMSPVQPSDQKSVAIPLGASPWLQQYDPADHTPYVFDFSGLLGNSEKIVSIEAVNVNATAALLGIGVEVDPLYAPLIDTAGKKCQIWFAVIPASWDLPSFDAAGVMLPITMRVATDSTPPKRYERTAVLTVRQL